MFTKQIWCGFALTFLLSAQGVSQNRNNGDGMKDEKLAVSTRSGAPASPADSTTDGEVTVGGQAIAYKAVAGMLTVGSSSIQDAMIGLDGGTLPNADENASKQATAQMFYVAYFKKNAGAGRPISFVYNGGPGGSSSLLHIGAFGPRRVVVPDTQLDGGAPYRTINNDYSLLDASDVVFIDAPGTGFGRIIGPNKEKAFWGTDQDTQAFDRFIQRFLTKYDRWNSPKYLIGESYGTLRNAQVAASLPYIHLNGIVMLSQILDFTHNADGQEFSPGVEEAYALALPTYAATAYYHHKLPSRPTSLESFLVEVEQYALGEYMNALLLGSELSETRKGAVAEKLHEYTGLPVAFLLKANLRVRGGIFSKNLLLDDQSTTGQNDARYKGPDLDPISEAGEYDPFINAVIPAYAAALNEYLRKDLKYGGDQTYKLLLGADDNFTWDWRHGAPGGPRAGVYPGIGTNVMPDLAFAMKSNPKMKVMLTGGYYDVVTPFFEGIYEMHHLPLPNNLQNNISYHYYPSGHMVYVKEEVLNQFHSDVATFIKETETSK